MDQFKIWLTEFLEQNVTELALRVLAVVLAVLFFNWLVRRVLVRFGKKARSTNTHWELSVVTAAKRPITVFAWIIGTSFVCHIIYVYAEVKFFQWFVTPLRIVGAISCLGWFLARFVSVAKEAIIHRRRAHGGEVDRTTFDAVAQLLRITIGIATFLFVMQSQGVSVSGVLAFGGIGGLAIGFAAKDLLANFFGSLVIYFDRPFAVGDWIRSPDKEIEGTVEEIGWRLTRIRTFEKRPLYVPNSLFSNISVENPSRMTNRRIKETIGLRYDDLDKAAVVASDIRQMLRAHPEIDTDQTLIVNVVQLNEYSVDILVSTYTRATALVRFHEIKEDILFRIAAIIKADGADFAYPTRVSLSAPLQPPAAAEVSGGAR